MLSNHPGTIENSQEIGTTYTTREEVDSINNHHCVGGLVARKPSTDATQMQRQTVPGSLEAKWPACL